MALWHTVFTEFYYAFKIGTYVLRRLSVALQSEPKLLTNGNRKNQERSMYTVC